ncbi:hypothetical protein [Gemmatimonas sp.]|uniref:hypothetical protein n=1 Tax=Gemmatimonas sp. TaxID=1962908 RepID=UPI00286DCE66|nr:hypothetical protein [Gemmatimonas sp.]
MIAINRWPQRAALAAALTLSAVSLPKVALAQTDYYNTDAGRPLQIEDAYAVERRALEIQAAPLRLERNRRGVYSWGIEPELAYGLFRRTQVEIGLPIALLDAGVGGKTVGITGLDASVLYNLNTETRIPALAIGASVLAPVGGLAADETYASVKGIATKTFRWARFHVNGQYTAGDAPVAAAGGADAVGAGASELSRWLSGVSVDRPLPLRSMLLSGEVFVRQPLHADEPLEWNAAVGTRVQLSPRVALDVGAGSRLSGDDKGWFATVGGAYVVGLPWRKR